MPKIKNRYDYIKVYRPNGLLFAEGKHKDLVDAIVLAEDNFHKEFGRYTTQTKTFMEILGVTGQWCVTIFEIEDCDFIR
jgi:hypothetical protein